MLISPNLDFSLNLPLNLKFRNNVGKWILREVLKKYIPTNLIERPKMGFGIPIGRWLRGPLKEWASDLLSQDSIKKEDFFNFEKIDECWQDHLKGNKNSSTSLWSILMFQEWISNQ